MNQNRFMKTVIWLVLIPALLLGMLAGCQQMQLSSGDPSTATSSVAPSSSTAPTSKPTTPTTAPTTAPTEPPTQPTEPPTQPTEPPTQPTEPAEPPAPPKPIPEHLLNNYYLLGRNQGACDKMTGKVMIMFVFVNDDESQWDDDGIKEAKTAIDGEMNRLETAAAGYGAKLDMTALYLNATVSGIFVEAGDTDTFTLEPVYYAMEAVDFEQALDDQNILEKGFGVDSVPVVFLANKTGRSFAAQAEETKQYMEFAVIFRSGLNALRHEVCHIFGAKDFYFPADTIAAQEKYLPNSIMRHSNKEVDDLTAYLIGWTDELSEAALQFLEATNHLTREEIEEAQKVS